MKLIKLMPLLALFMIFGSCENNEKEAEEVVAEEEAVVDEDEVFTLWTDAWNSGNAQNVRTMIADDAVLVLNGREVPRDSLSAWIDESAGAMKDLRQTTLQKNNSGTMAYDTGTFSHGIQGNDTLQYSGTYTFVFERPEGSDQWQAVVMDISDATAENQ